MKILGCVLASARAWNKGSCYEDGTQPESTMLCKNSCSFDWLGRGDNVMYKDMGKSEFSLTAQMVALKWSLPYLNKDDGYVGMLRLFSTPFFSHIQLALDLTELIANVPFFARSATGPSPSMSGIEPMTTISPKPNTTSSPPTDQKQKKLQLFSFDDLNISKAIS